MDRWSSGVDEVLYALLGVRLGEVGCCDVWELHKQQVILVGGTGNVRRGKSVWAKWKGVVVCCVHKPFAFDVDQLGVGAQEISS